MVRKRRWRRGLAFLLLLGLWVAGAAWASAAAQEMRFFRIGTGNVGGSYFPIGGLLGRVISSPPDSGPCEEGGNCGVPGLIGVTQSTSGSVANLAAIGGGRLASVGGASGEIPEVSVLALMAADCDLIGISCGAYAARDPSAFAEDFEQLGSWYVEGKLNPHISATFPLEQVADALNVLVTRKVIGKVVLTMGRE